MIRSCRHVALVGESTQGGDFAERRIVVVDKMLRQRNSTVQ